MITHYYDEQGNGKKGNEAKDKEKSSVTPVRLWFQCILVISNRNKV